VTEREQKERPVVEVAGRLTLVTETTQSTEKAARSR
jgi:hypothetical protein